MSDNKYYVNFGKPRPIPLPPGYCPPFSGLSIPNIRSHNDYTALGWATARGNNAVAQLLRKAGGKP